MIANAKDQYIKIVKWLKDAEENGWDIEINQWFPKRTILQNRYFHFIMHFCGNHFGYPIQEMKIEAKRALIELDFVVLSYTNKKGVERTELTSSASWNTKQMTTFIEAWRDLCGRIGFYVPSPDEYKINEITLLNQLKNETYKR